MAVPLLLSEGLQDDAQEGSIQGRKAKTVPSKKSLNLENVLNLVC